MGRKKKVKVDAPSSITISLYDEGMTRTARAGLGGLAATLHGLEQDIMAGRVADDQIPGGKPKQRGQYPWKVNKDSVTLDFGKPNKAREFLDRLCKYGFQLKDGIIHLPGADNGSGRPNVVNARLHNAIFGTYLKHKSSYTTSTYETGVTLKNGKKEKKRNYKIVAPLGEDETTTVDSVRCAILEDYRHQTAAEELTNKDGTLLDKLEMAQWMVPGIASRFRADKGLVQVSVGIALAESFSMVGCVSLGVERSEGTCVVFVPDVSDIEVFARCRWQLTPNDIHRCRIQNPSDAVLRVEVARRAINVKEKVDGRDCYASVIDKKAWNKNCAVRSDVISAADVSSEQLESYDVARGAVRDGRDGKCSSSNPLRGKIAKNIIDDLPWWKGIDEIMFGLMSDKYDRGRAWAYGKGLTTMVETQLRDQDRKALVSAVREAFNIKWAKYYPKVDGQHNRKWGDKHEGLARELKAARTYGVLRDWLCTLLLDNRPRAIKSTEGVNSIISLINENTWEDARCMAMLGLATAGKFSDSEESEKVVV